MTPREKLKAALEFQPYEGLPPHLELEFQLSEEVFGERPIWFDFETIPGHKRRDELVRNARLWIRVAEAFDYSVILGTNWMPPEAQVETFEIVRELSGDRYMLCAFRDPTLAIPNGQDMASLSFRIADDPDGLMAEQEDRLEQEIAVTRELIQAGAEIVFMCSDYCFNSGPFLSPRMFRRFVTPYLKRFVKAVREEGAYTVKHTDGNISPILDQLLECRPHALHSIDPMAGMDIRQVRAQVGDTVCLMGNVDCSRLQSGTSEEIIASAEYCLEHGPWNRTGYVYASSNCVFQGVPFQSYRTMLEVRSRWSSKTTENE